MRDCSHVCFEVDGWPGAFEGDCVRVGKYLPSEMLLSSRALLDQGSGVRVLLEVVGPHEQQKRRDFLHQAQVLVLYHCLVTLGDFLVVLEVDELLEDSEILVELSLDLRLGSRKVRLVFVLELGEAEVGFDLVDGLLDESTSLLAHDVEEEELEVALVSGRDGRHKFLLDELTDALEVDEVPLQRRVLHLEHIEKALQAELQVLGQVELRHTRVNDDSGHLNVGEEPVVLQDVLCRYFVVQDADFVEEAEGKVGSHLAVGKFDRSEAFPCFLHRRKLIFDHSFVVDNLWRFG